MANDPPLTKDNKQLPIIHIEGEEDMVPEELEMLRAWIMKKEMQERLWDELERTSVDNSEDE